MSEIDLKGIIELDKVLIEKDKEIEKLQKILRTKTRLHRKRKAKLRKLRKEVTNKQKKLELYKSIIKEVREKINKGLDIKSEYIDYDFGTELLRHELLEILDKVEENTNEKV